MSRGRALAFAPPGRIPVDLLVPVMGGVVLGLLLVVRLPLAAAAAVAALGGLGLLIVGARSTVALGLLVPGVILGGMKFRIRGAGESLSGAVDANVLFELGMYGVVLALALSTALNRRLLPHSTVQGGGVAARLRGMGDAHGALVGEPDLHRSAWAPALCPGGGQRPSSCAPRPLNGSWSAQAWPTVPS